MFHHFFEKIFAKRSDNRQKTLARPSSSILIVKTSSLGDVIQSFPVLTDLKKRFPDACIDWAIEKSFASILSAHPLVRRPLFFSFKELKKRWFALSAWKAFFQEISLLRKVSYDYVFDLQGNCKSGLITLFAKGRFKVGFGKKSVREWPNLLTTRYQFEVPKELNIRLQHLKLIEQFFRDSTPPDEEGVRFLLQSEEKKRIEAILQKEEMRGALKVMVCPGSKWETKQLSLETWKQFLTKIEKKWQASFLLIWGEEKERKLVEEIHKVLPARSVIVEKLTLPSWQNLMSEVDLVLAVDSSALHLCGTTKTASFSVFGPTSAEVFKPIGTRHFAFVGKCPYDRRFKKSCPLLRSCVTAACMKDINAEELFTSFTTWLSESYP